MVKMIQKLVNRTVRLFEFIGCFQPGESFAFSTDRRDKLWEDSCEVRWKLELVDWISGRHILIEL